METVQIHKHQHKSKQVAMVNCGVNEKKKHMDKKNIIKKIHY